MARRNKKNRNKQQSNQKKNQPKTQQKKADEPKEVAENLESNLDKVIVDNSISEVEIKEVKKEEVKTTTEASYKSAQELYHKALAIEKVLERRKSDYEKLKEKLDSEKKVLENEKSENEKLKTELNKTLDKYNEELTEINQLRVEGVWSSVIDKKLLDHYQEKLKEQEKTLLNKIAELNSKHSEYISALAEIETKKLDVEKEYHLKFTEKSKRLEKIYQEKFTSKENELHLLSKDIDEQKRLLARKEKQLSYEVEDFEDDKKFLTDKARNKVEQEIEGVNQQLQNLKDKNKALGNELKSLNDELKYLGDYKAKDVISELRSKEKEIFELQERLATSPDILKIDDLKKLQKEKNDWQNRLRDINSQLNEYKSRYENQKLQIGEKERLEFQKEELEQRIKLQQSALEELKEEVSELTRQTEDKITFVSCSEMDDKYKLQPENLIQNNINKGWIKEIQQAIAQVTENRLFYDENTIRSFIAGLSMSRFSILQGISGTGKTSLPKAFAKAVGGNFGIVEVQSGWKDRQDLIGYYNTFEKKYYEGKFLKLLYMAGTPKYKDKPFFIILDEMNLSHPEHYFADMLSIMEETNLEKQVLTISDKVKDKPRLMFDLEEGGIGLKVPQNVWFIGTANHDETTLQFAPKTYDRANILEMPINIEEFEIKNVDLSKVTIPNKEFINFTSSQKWNKNHRALNYLEGNFKNICGKFGIGWGNRLQKQVKTFIPVFKALEGDDANALDHIISSKILRSIKGRYDLQETTLNEMKDELEKNFNKEFKGEAKKSLKIVNNELSRLE
ncbi:AAA family ATPase [Lutibacter holmesii]|uniref:AAA family ATPase n=1 Tax=Lutibacter holmesii TaxID=1137985 RepID=A0ABW3WLQ7_9FLAO